MELNTTLKVQPKGGDGPGRDRKGGTNKATDKQPRARKGGKRRTPKGVQPPGPPEEDPYRIFRILLRIYESKILLIF